MFVCIKRRGPNRLHKDEVLSSCARTLVIDRSFCPPSMAPWCDQILEPGGLVFHAMARASVAKVRTSCFALTWNTNLFTPFQHFCFYWFWACPGTLNHSKHHAVSARFYKVMWNWFWIQLTGHHFLPPWRSWGSGGHHISDPQAGCSWQAGS